MKKYLTLLLLAVGLSANAQISICAETWIPLFPQVVLTVDSNTNLDANGVSLMPDNYLFQPFYTPTNSADVTLGNLAGMMRWDTNYVYVGVSSNQWKRAALSAF